MITRTLPLLLVAAMAVSAGGQPPDRKGVKAKDPPAPAYTAFPDLKPPADGKTVELPPLPTEPADASPLRKVQFAQLKEGLAYLTCVERALQIAGPNELDLERNTKLAADVCRLAAELEAVPARKASWHEARVRHYKLFEEYARRRVDAGTVNPARLHAAAFARLEAEADLLKLKADKAPRQE